MPEKTRLNSLMGDNKLLFKGPEWDFEKLRRVYDAVEEIATKELGLDVYPNQIEVITSEQMLDAYASIGLPLMYRHWSFGKHFAREEALYRHGYQGLAYEIVINSSPCISYIMEENSMAMQTLVVAHAAFGHNHFFKNNFLFKQWTDATGILDYLTFARDYVAHAEESYDDIWRTAQLAVESASMDKKAAQRELAAIRQKLGLPEENILYFLEKRAPRLKPWQRELVRIARHISQYFYPQKQTKMMNEGCATFVHYEIVHRLHEKGLISDGALLEIMHSHTSVVTQPDYDDQRYSGINPYALGFAMMRDIKRICLDPSAEDRQWFPDIAGNNDPYGTLRHAWANYRDESFVLQYLSPRVMRDFRLFKIVDDADAEAMVVDAIHEERGYREIRRALARNYDLARHEPDIQIRDVDLEGDRCLVLSHAVHDGVLLDEANAHAVLEQLSALWYYGIRLEEVDAVTDRVLKTHEVAAKH